MSKSSKRNPANNQDGPRSTGGDQDPYVQYILAYLEKEASHIVNIMIPVSICLLMVFFIIKTIDFDASFINILIVVAGTEIVNFHREGTQLTPFDSEDESFDSETESVGEKALKSTGIVFALLCLLILGSAILVISYKYGRKKLISGLFMLLDLLILTFGPVICIIVLTREYKISCSTISALFFAFNFSVLGMMSLHWKVTRKLHPSYLSAKSILWSFFFLKVSGTLFPAGTTWVCLVVVAIYDLFNVFHSKGPIRMLMEMSDGLNDPTFSSMVYSTNASNPSAEFEESDEVEENDKAEGIREEHKALYAAHMAFCVRFAPSEGKKLGVGDFLSYSILIGKAASFNDWNTTIAVFIAILAGLCITLVLARVTERDALPGLPLPIFLGIIFSFGTHYAITPFLNEIARQQFVF